MVNIDPKKYRIPLIVGILIVLSLFTFWIRILPAPHLIVGDAYVLGQEPDISYNLRLIEQMLANYPKYPLFDPMTTYPFGTIVFWGPMFTFIVSSICLITGATTQGAIADIAFIIPTIMAVLMVPVMYCIGRFLADWKTGLFSALFISIVSGQFVYRSLYGFADHHIAEVLFSTIFCLMYVVALVYSRNHTISFSKQDSLKIPLFLASLSGLTFLAGLLTMPTMILFGLIVGVFTVAQFFWDHYKNKDGSYLVILNIVTFSIPIIGLLLIGFNDPTLTLARYSPAQVFAYILLIIGTLYLYLTRTITKEKKVLYPLIVFGTGAIIILASLLLASSFFASFQSAFTQFFGLQPTTLTIQELRPWSPGEAWFTYHIGWVLVAIGLTLTIYRNLREEKPDHFFVLIWSLFILYSTFMHVRYEYYLGPVIALLASLGVGAVISYTEKDVIGFIYRRTAEKEAENYQSDSVVKSGKKKVQREKGKKIKKIAFDPLMLGLFLATMACTIIFVGLSVNYNYQVGNAMGYNIMHPDWRETTEWLGNHTPDPGVDYTTIYDKATFQYPPQSYGVMSWWDYGHWITFFAHRIPHANPFQEGVAGPYGAASFFLVPTEDKVTAIADYLGTKYVITDIEMDTGKFWAMSTWYNETLGDRPYHQIYLVTSPDNPTTYEPVSLTTQAYYLTMISRLHNFDGSIGEPSVAYYIEYRDGTTATRNYPIVTQVDVMNATEAMVIAADYNTNAPTGSHATVLSTSLISPISRVPALRHFRLIHESPTNVMGNSGDMRYVKAFEYVKGAHIKGEGIIEIPIITNGGRTYVYRQESVNGEFVVPYSTEGSQYEVKATGPYRISGTNSTFLVSEDAVQKGLTIN